MTLQSIALWHQRVSPNKTPRQFTVQLGCHVEEFVEMLQSLEFTEVESPNLPRLEGSEYPATFLIEQLANMLKKGVLIAHPKNEQEFAGAMADQIVTGMGCMVAGGLPAVEIVDEVNRSNWSKFDSDGQPIRDANGKCSKGPAYSPPDLSSILFKRVKADDTEGGTV